MTTRQIETAVAGLKSNAGMITVWRHDRDGVASVHRTFRVDSVVKFLKRHKRARYSVSQKAEDKPCVTS